VSDSRSRSDLSTRLGRRFSESVNPSGDFESVEGTENDTVKDFTDPSKEVERRQSRSRASFFDSDPREERDDREPVRLPGRR
jgi:hypothetical protein